MGEQSKQASPSGFPIPVKTACNKSPQTSPAVAIFCLWLLRLGIQESSSWVLLVQGPHEVIVRWWLPLEQQGQGVLGHLSASQAAVSFKVASEPLLVVSLHGLVWDSSQCDVFRAVRRLIGQQKVLRVSFPEGKQRLHCLLGLSLGSHTGSLLLHSFIQK